MPIERGGGARSGSVSAQAGRAWALPTAGPPALYPGAVVHVELGGVKLSSRFADESSRLGIVVHASDPDQAWELLDGQAALVATVDPYDLQPSVAFVRELRRRGSTVGVVAVSQTRGLRATTPIPLRRAGVDEFVALSAGADEYALRLASALALTRARWGKELAEALPSWVQPRGPDGGHRLMAGDELAAALRERLAVPREGPFVLVLLRPRGDDAWELLRRRVRLDEGDLVASVGYRVMAVALEGMPGALASAAVSRLIRPLPGFPGGDLLGVLELPEDRDSVLDLVEEWTAR